MNLSDLHINDLVFVEAKSNDIFTDFYGVVKEVNAEYAVIEELVTPYHDCWSCWPDQIYSLN